MKINQAKDFEPLYDEVRNFFLRQQGYSTLEREKESRPDSSADMPPSRPPRLTTPTLTTINDEGLKREVKLNTNTVIVYSSKSGY